MNIWNKILLGFIFVAAIAEAFLGAKTLNIHKIWRESYNTQVSEIERLEGEIAKTKRAWSEEDDITAAGLGQLGLISDRMSIARGRIFPNCQPSTARPTGASLQVNVRTTIPDPNGIQPGEILYVFEGGKFVEPVVTPDPADPSTEFASPDEDMADDPEEETSAEETPGLYLGAFNVSAINGNVVVLVPAYSLLPEEIQAIVSSSQSERCWILHDTMPHDDPSLLAEKTDEEIRAFFEAAFTNTLVAMGKTDAEVQEALQSNLTYLDYVEEFIRDREDRNLRDYQFLFAECHRIRATQEVRRDQLEAAVATAEEDLRLCDEQAAHRVEQIADYTAEIGRLGDELELVKTHQKALQDRIDELEIMIEEKLASNASLAAQLARAQEEAIATADQTTGPGASTP